MGRWQGLILGGGVMLVLAGAGLLLGPAGRASGAGAVISIAPPSQQMLMTDAAFNIEIKVENVENLGAFELNLKYDPAVLDYLGAVGTGYLTTTGRAEQCLPGTGYLDAGIVNYGCNTLGLVQNGQGNPGPTGSGSLAIFAFQPKAAGHSDLTLVGLDEPYVYITNGVTQHAQTSFDAVETCSGGQCESAPIGFDAKTGIVQVNDPNAGPTATAVPPTPTPQPRAAATPNRQATARAVLGTPERTLGQSSTTNTSGGATGGSTAGDTGSSGVLASAAGPDGVMGTADDGQAVGDGSVAGVRGLPNANGDLLSAGGATGPGGVGRGANGVPIAGYGPPPSHQNPWFGRAGALMIVLGALALACGVTARNWTPVSNARV